MAEVADSHTASFLKIEKIKIYVNSKTGKLETQLGFITKLMTQNLPFSEYKTFAGQERRLKKKKKKKRKKKKKKDKSTGRYYSSSLLRDLSLSSQISRM